MMEIEETKLQKSNKGEGKKGSRDRKKHTVPIFLFSNVYSISVFVCGLDVHTLMAEAAMQLLIRSCT